MKKTDAISESQGAVHTSAQPTDVAHAGKSTKPSHHQPTKLPPRDEHSGKGGRFVRDPVSGVRTPIAE
ncbi:hypothetical protein ACQYWY_20355 [Comamonas sediminis]|uniref:hypothetical protein n=1 Tax=Comamonas sediminis TaxID=1783360 RepID=UPI003D2BD3F6